MDSSAKKYLVFLGCGVFIIGLGLLAYLGTFNRYFADDWCYNKDLNRLGLVGTLKGYTTITTYASNRYSLTLLSGLIYTLGILGVQVMTALTLIMWLGGIAWTLYNLNTINRRTPLPGSIILIASIIVYFTAYLAPHRYQNLYWRSGLLPYTAPLVFIPYITGAITHQIRLSKASTVLVLIAAFTTFLAGGFSEAACTTLVTGLGIYALAAVMGTWLRQNWARKTILIAGVSLGFAILALVLLVTSPANETRLLQHYGPPTRLIELPRMVLVYTYFYIRVVTSENPLPFMAIFALPFTLACLAGPPKWTSLEGCRVITPFLIIGMVTSLLIAASLTPSLYIEGGMPAPRAQIIPLFSLICAIVAVGWLAGSFVRSKIRVRWSQTAGVFNITGIIIFCLGILFTAHTIIDTSSKLTIYKERAAIWDERDRAIWEAVSHGLEEVEVRGIDSQPIGGLHDLKADGKHWVNHCAARYYGVKSIRASLDPD
jgi:hypothetical protein